MRLVAFDPVIDGPGVAYLKDGQVVQAWSIQTQTEGDSRYSEIWKHLEYDLTELPAQCEHAAIEMPDKWTRKNVEEKIVGAPANVLSLQKVCTVVGVIIGVCNSFDLRVHLYRPRQWKGRKSKVVTKAELQIQGYNLEMLRWDDHACDAAALALWAEGQIRVEEKARLVEEKARS